MTRSAILTLSVFALLISFAFVPSTDDDALTRIITKLMNYQASRPQEKLYLHIDKPIYAAGEDLWFKVYLVDGTHLQMDSSISKVTYVELLHSSHKVLERKMLYSPAGSTFGDFHLDHNLPQGNYLIRAYTNYMKNLGEEFFFKKEFALINTAGEKSIDDAGTTAGLDLQFFPEGGNMIAGIDNRIAFKAVNPQGRSVAVEGEIVDEENKTVTTFTTEHQGMGSFRMMVFPNKKYIARLKKPVSASTTFPLPAPLEKGYLMQVTDAGENIRLIIYNNAERSAANPTLFNLVAQSRGEVCFAAKGEIKTTTVTATIPKSKFPSGIAQLTVFDGAGLPQCERLVFINHGHTLSFQLTPDKTSYKKREKVALDIMVKDHKGEPAKGEFSISVYDETRIHNPEQFPTSVADHFLLTSDLTGYIEDAGYYLKDRSAETVRHLDLLMLTHGWRRFTWKEVLSDELKPLAHFAEKGIAISGTILRSIGSKPAANSKLKILTPKGDVVMFETDGEGKFYNDDLVYFDSSRLAIQTENAKGKQLELKLNINPFNQSPGSGFAFSPFKDPDAKAFVEQTSGKMRVEDAFRQEEDARLLKEIEITSTAIVEPSHMKLYGTPTATVKMKDVPDGYVNVLQALQGRVPGVIVRGSPPSMTITLRSGYESPLFLLNGTPVDLEVINGLVPSDIESIDVVRGTAAAVYGSRALNGVLAVYTKSGEYAARKPVIGMHQVKYPGFYIAREFYSPKYDAPSDERSMPDIRNTLYWNPVIETDAQGTAQVSFYTSDVVSHYKIEIQGLSFNGFPGYGAAALDIK